jgi:hypothetical protein
MKRLPQFLSLQPRRASALVVALLAVVVVTILTVTLMVISRLERVSSNLSWNKARSESLADLAADVAMLRMKEATEAGMSTGKMWISEPGRIRVYDRANLENVTDYDLFSGLPGADDPAVKDRLNVDLNKPAFEAGTNGRYPIAEPAAGKSAATMKVGWINVLEDMNAPAAQSNQLTGRVAFWVDDESCKVNLNTADGSKKEDLYRRLGVDEVSGSFGWGTPSEISLQALKDISNVELTKEMAAAIADYAWTRGFNSAAEVSRVPTLPASFFQVNKFNLTHYSKIPELNFHGEPRINLFPVVRQTGDPTFAKIRSLAVGPLSNYASGYLMGGDNANRKAISGDIDFIYPIRNQFTFPLEPYATMVHTGLNDEVLTWEGNSKLYITRIAAAIHGKDAQGNAVQWPAFGGITTGFTKKYSERQADSLAVQIFDMSNTTVFPEQDRSSTMPTIALDGFINSETDPAKSKRVIGLNRFLKLTELTFQATASSATIAGTPVSQLQLDAEMEYCVPENYLGAPMGGNYQAAIAQFGINNDQAAGNGMVRVGGLNMADSVNRPSASSTDCTPAWMSGYWQDKLLRIEDQSGQPAGIDLSGHKNTTPDPDQALAQQYHPFRWNGTAYMGSTTSSYGALKFPSIMNGQMAWAPGMYASVSSRAGTGYFPGKPGLTAMNFRGGVTLWTRTGTGASGMRHWELVPLDSIRGAFTGEARTPEINQYLQEAVMPVEFDLPLSGANGAGIEDIVIRVKDPLVNKFPGDWEGVVSPAATDITKYSNADNNNNPRLYKKGGAASLDTAYTYPAGTDQSSNKDRFVRDVNGDNPGYRPAGGGDPLSLWLPRVDLRYPKQSRFPSVGALNFIRTGMIPDDLAVPLKQQRGVPWRSINLSAAGSDSQSVHGVKYPDWAMLDLFTVPFLPQRPYPTGDFTTVPKPAQMSDTVTPLRKLTYGGATEGKLNINNPRVPYPFAETPAVNTAPPERTAPLEALFYGIKTSGGTATEAYDGNGKPVLTKVDHAALAEAVQDYLENKDKRFLLPGQLADIPEVDALTYRGVDAAARSRNDLMRQVVGATTTQGNVFSVWVVAQTIRKAPKNSQHGVYEAGDVVTGETRRRYLVERHLEYGKDGVPGNANDPGLDTIVGTADDPVDPVYHPQLSLPLPYRWRVVSVEAMTN